MFKKRTVAVIAPLAVVAAAAMASVAAAESGVRSGSASPAPTSQPEDALLSGKDALTPFERAAAPAPIVNLPPSGTPITAASQAVDIVKSHTANVKRVDAIRAFPMTFGSLLDAVRSDGTGAEMPAGFTSEQSVWAVVAVGSYRPQFAKNDDDYQWGIEVLDAGMGVPLASFAGLAELPEAFQVMMGTAPG